MEAFSTNYRRTQLSAQGFLDGLRGGRGGVPVVVRPRAADFLNQWESKGREMTEVRKPSRDHSPTCSNLTLERIVALMRLPLMITPRLGGCVARSVPSETGSRIPDDVATARMYKRGGAAKDH